MARIVIRLDSQKLDNPDADIRYLLPRLLAERSGGAISDDGYDYVGPDSQLILFLKTSNHCNRNGAEKFTALTAKEVIGALGKKS